MTAKEAFEKAQEFVNTFLKKRKFFFVRDEGIKMVVPKTFYTICINYYPENDKDDFGIVIETPLGTLPIEDASFEVKEAVEKLLQKLEEEL